MGQLQSSKTSYKRSKSSPFECAVTFITTERSEINKINTYVDRKLLDDTPKLSPAVVKKKTNGSKYETHSEASFSGEQKTSQTKEGKVTTKVGASNFASSPQPQKERDSLKSKKGTAKHKGEISREDLVQKRKEQLQKKKRNYQLAHRISYSNNNLIEIASVLEQEIVNSNDPGSFLV